MTERKLLMTVYLVDFENVRSEGLKGVDRLSEGDKVVIFYSKNAENISFDVHTLLNNSKAEIETFRILRGGRNSLDFQLSTYLGYLVMENCYKKIFIVSQDKGFLCAISFWEVNSEICNAEIKLCKSISNAELENSTSADYDDGLTGKFLERVEVKKQHKNNSGIPAQNKGSSETSKTTLMVMQRSDNNTEGKANIRKSNVKSGFVNNYNRTTTHTSAGTYNSFSRSTRGRTYGENLKKKSDNTRQNHINLNVQNPTSKNKIFAAEVKLNIADDIREIISGKYDESYIPVLVEVIGKSTGKQHFYRMLVSRFGQETGHNMYMMIKGQYTNLKRK